MNMPDRIRKPLSTVLTFVAVEKLIVFINVARNDIEVESLCRFRFAIHEERETLGARVTEPFFNCQSIAFRLRYLLALFVDRKSTRLNSSHSSISYAVFCLKKKKKKI